MEGITVLNGRVYEVTLRIDTIKEDTDVLRA